MSEEEITVKITTDGIYELFSYIESREDSLNINILKHIRELGFSASVLCAKPRSPTPQDFVDFAVEFGILIKFLYPMIEQLETSISKNVEIDWKELWEM